MFGQLWSTFSALHVGAAFGMLVNEILLLIEKKINEKPKNNWEIKGEEDMISTLPDDLLVRILLLVPTEDAVATMFLSKRWQSIWTMMPKLVYNEIIDDNTNKVVIGGLLGRLLHRLFGKRDRCAAHLQQFIDKSLQVHKAHVLETLVIELGPRCPVDVGKWIANAVDRKVRELGFRLRWSAEPTSLPKSLYTCNTLVSMGLSNKILVDVPPHACLPSLKNHGLYFVVYKDDDSLIRLFSSCPTLKNLCVERHHQDNVKSFNIKVPSLERLSYENVELGAHDGSLVIDSPALKKIFITDYSGDSCSIENKPRLEKASIDLFCYPDYKFKRSLSSVMYLELVWSVATLAWFNNINSLPQLIECQITLLEELDWFEPLMLLLQKSPKLKALFINEMFIKVEEDLRLSWNQPSSVPGCLSNHLEVFEWKGYRGRRNERQIVRYIFANSKCLKRARFSFKAIYFQIIKIIELKSMPRVSTSSQLLFPTQLENMMSVDKEMTEED